jgi:hypothetical protein
LTLDPPSPVAPHICGETVTVVWNYTSDCDKPHSCTAYFTITGATSLTVDLRTGWNIFSSNNAPAEPDMKDLFMPLITAGKLIKIQDEYGNSLEDYGILGGWVNNIGDLELTEGYKVKVNNDCQITFTGTPAVRPFEIPLHPGWNIIGYPHTSILDGMVVAQQLIDRETLIKMQDEFGNAIEDYGILGGWVNNIGNFYPGEGYKVKVKSEETLTIYESYSKYASVPLTFESTVHFKTGGSGNGTDHMNINLVTISRIGLKKGDEIAVYDGNLCVGAVKISDRQLTSDIASIPVRANDGMGGLGFTEGNLFTLKTWDFETGAEGIIIPEIVKSSSTFVKHESTFIIPKKLISTGLGEKPLSGVTEVKCYPNPFNDCINIEIKLSGDSRLQLDIINQVGRRSGRCCPV